MIQLEVRHKRERVLHKLAKAGPSEELEQRRLLSYQILSFNNIEIYIKDYG